MKDFINSNYKEEYLKWMEKKNTKNNSNVIFSYIKSIEILSEILEYNIFEIRDVEKLKTLYKDLLAEQKNVNGKYYYEDALSYGSNGFYSASIKSYIEFLNNYLNKEYMHKNIKEVNMSLNQILFGPPGTGKTFNTINKALEIIDNEFFQQNENDRTALKDKFEEYKKTGQIEFVTFHQSYGYEEFVEGIKADLDSDEIKYKLEKGIFKRLSNLAELNYRKSIATIETKKDFATLFKEQILDKLIDDEKLKISTPKKHFFITEVNEKTIFFEKAEGQTDHSLSIRTLKEMYESGKNEKIKGGLSVYYEPILNLLLQNSLFDKVDKEPLKNHILIIDEINRGNISKIFGELITLIEPSKRIGADEEIKVKLPYSNDDFGVPQNLYILGTMNTADRSIALMDTALRRRFEFIEMLPDLEVLNDLEVDGINIKLMLEKINQRVEYLYDRDHTIGHAYFMSLKDNPTLEELENIFKNKIIPLLQEYFYDDWEKIRLVLGDNQKEEKNQFIKIKKDYDIKSLFGANIEMDLDDEQKIYEINKEAFKDSQSYVKIYSK